MAKSLVKKLQKIEKKTFWNLFSRKGKKMRKRFGLPKLAGFSELLLSMGTTLPIVGKIAEAAGILPQGRTLLAVQKVTEVVNSAMTAAHDVAAQETPVVVTLDDSEDMV